MTDETAPEASETEDEPELDDADLPSDDEEEADPPPHDATVAPVDPDAGEEV
jgi:hypothetical protein